MAKRIGIMLPTMFTEKGFRKLQLPVIVQPKLEGDRLRSTIGELSVSLKSSGDKIRRSVPHIHDELKNSGVFTNIELDGELYKHGCRHSEIRSIVSRTRNLHEDYKSIEYHVYDIVSNKPQEERLTVLENLMKYEECRYIKLVTSYNAYSLEEVQQHYNRFLKQGYEGIIIRDTQSGYKRRKVTTMLKLKPRVSDSFKIIGVIEEVSLAGVPKNTFGAFKCITNEGNEFNVGTGVTDTQRRLIWMCKEGFIGTLVKIRFQDYTQANRVPKMQSIDKEWAACVEIAMKKFALIATGGSLE